MIIAPPQRRTVVVIMTCRACGTTTRRDWPQERIGARWVAPLAGCQCGATVVPAPIVATHDPAVPCDARCERGRGPACRCSCGGANHGAAWAAS